MHRQESPIAVNNKLIKQRITPTFIHHDIFGLGRNQQALNVRYTPTFASTVFDCQGYDITTTHSRPSKGITNIINSPMQPVVFINQAKERKMAELNPCCHWDQSERWGLELDPKNRVMEEINSLGGRTSRMRKIVEQSSNPIFGSGYFWEPSRPDHPQTQRAYSPEPYARAKEVKSQEKIPVEKHPKEEIVQQNRNPIQKPDLVREEKRDRKVDVKQKKKSAKQPKPSDQSKKLARFKSVGNLHPKATPSRP